MKTAIEWTRGTAIYPETVEAIREEALHAAASKAHAAAIKGGVEYVVAGKICDAALNAGKPKLRKGKVVGVIVEEPGYFDKDGSTDVRRIDIPLGCKWIELCDESGNRTVEVWTDGGERSTPHVKQGASVYLKAAMDG